jgi:cellulose synthase/poly-beta-1,6-N-acetylglucosamine synthase-like glycosyltransferase
MGTGMAMPWDVVRSVDLANGSIVEDLRLGLDLARAGHLPFFCPSARVSSEFASSAKGAKIQRARWEQGHIQTILIAAPRLARRAISQRNWGLLALALDLAVPPLSLLAMLVIGMFLVASLTTLFGLSSVAMPISIAAVSALMLAIFLAWLKCGRDVLPIEATLSIVPYVVGKLGVYGRILSRRLDARWIKTDRTKSE